MTLDEITFRSDYRIGAQSAYEQQLRDHHADYKSVLYSKYNRSAVFRQVDIRPAISSAALVIIIITIIMTASSV